MPKLRAIQHRFTAGEIDPKMLGRSDLEQYYSAAEKMENVFVIPQGGFTRRPGLQYLDTLDGLLSIVPPTTSNINYLVGGSASDLWDDADSIVITRPDEGISSQVIVEYDFGSTIEINRIVMKDFIISDHQAITGNPTYRVQGSLDNMTWDNLYDMEFDGYVSGSQTENAIFAPNTSYRYIRLLNLNGTTNVAAEFRMREFRIEVFSGISETRLINFAFNTDQSYVIALTDKTMTIYKDGVKQAQLYNNELLSSRLSTVNYTQSADTAILVNKDFSPLRLTRISDTVWNLEKITFEFIPLYDFVPTSNNPNGDITPSAREGSVEITSPSGVFASSDVNQYIEGNGGRARIVKYNNPSKVQAIAETPFYDTETIVSGNWTLRRGYEVVWSSSRGYPSSIVFHEGRLWFGGSKSRPHTLWGSRINQFYNFDIGESLDDEALSITLDTNQLNQINNLYAGKNLQIYTSAAEFVIEQDIGEPITPTNINIKRQSSIGIQEGLRPLEIEGSVLYVQNEGKSVQEFVYSDGIQTYSNNYVSLLSGHLVDNPVDFDLRKSTSTEEGAYLLMVSGSGFLTVATVLRSQNITAFTRQTTDGLFKSCAVDGSDMYFVVERQTDGDTYSYLERFNNDHFMDSSTRITTGLPTDTFNGLDHLEGKLCKVKSDGSVMQDRTVASGQVVIERQAQNEFEIGINFTPLVKDLPVEALQNVVGTSLGLRKNISEIVLRLYETISMKVNGKVLLFRGFGPSGGGSPLDSSPPEFTGTKVLKGFRGWTDDAQVTITQEQPVKMTVIGLSKRINIVG